jgi:hypothetical protein
MRRITERIGGIITRTLTETLRRNIIMERIIMTKEI